MLHSVLTHCGEHEVQIHYLHPPGLSQEVVNAMREMILREGGLIDFIEIPDSWVAGLPRWDYIPSTMWHRIFLPDLLPEVDRILYLDVDTVVVDDLSPLFRVDLSDWYVGAVTNVFQLDHLHRLRQLGIDDPREYFNSGVLLMNLDLMRRDGCSQALREHALRDRTLLWPDQDALNAVLGPRRRPLHPRWNVMNSVLRFPWSMYAFGARDLTEARTSPAIRHFEGPTINKPWHLLCDGPMRELYFAHRRQTPWPETRIEGKTLRNLIKRFARGGARRLRSRRKARFTL